MGLRRRYAYYAAVLMLGRIAGPESSRDHLFEFFKRCFWCTEWTVLTDYRPTRGPAWWKFLLFIHLDHSK